jgi:long-chain acyl-CoA synthetase
VTIDLLLELFSANKEKDAIVWRDDVCSYGELLDEVGKQRDYLDAACVRHGAVVALEGDFSPVGIALLLALAEAGCVVVPLTESVRSKREEFMSIAGVEVLIEINAADDANLVRFSETKEHELVDRLRASGHPGIVLFSSGSTGPSKAAIHDLLPLLAKFRPGGRGKRMLTFLLFDHIGGVNTLFYVLSNAGCLVTVPDRSPDTVCEAIERHRVQVLPTSPTFVNLMMLSGAYKRHNISSLRVVTYGTEVMPKGTLTRFHEFLPKVRLMQTYGLSEVGIMQTKSRASDSLWVKVGGDGFETRIVDGMLEIRSESAMLGYLNADYPFTEDGWMRTGDVVEQDGEYIKILGRESEIINVGGEKVYPAEVEDVMQEMPGVADVAVCGEPSPITGQMVVARVKLDRDESLSSFRKRMRSFCKGRLPGFKIPQKVELVTEAMHGGRFKKMRRVDSQGRGSD